MNNTTQGTVAAVVDGLMTYTGAVGHVRWLELLMWPTMAPDGGGDHPTAMTTHVFEGMPYLPVRLHCVMGDEQALEALSPDGATATTQQQQQQQQQQPGQINARTLAMPTAAGVEKRQSRAQQQQQQHEGLPPALYPDYLALVGKLEAGVKGAGISARAAKTLLRRCEQSIML